MTDFMPENADRVPETKGHFFKLKDGVNKFRFLSSPKIGYETWEDDGSQYGKPIRTKHRLAEPSFKVMNDKWGNPKLNKYFRVFMIWDYTSEKVMQFHLDKKGVLKAIEDYVYDTENPKKQDPRNYDMSIKKTGSGIETEYKHGIFDNEELSEEIKSEWAEIEPTVDLEDYFEDGEIEPKKEKSNEDLPFN